MAVLIVEENSDLARVWQRSLDRFGVSVSIAHSQDQAVAAMQTGRYDIIILDLDRSDDSALAIADFANYRLPSTQILFVTNRSFFSDGSIFRMFSNACGFVQSQTPPDDLAAIAHHHAGWTDHAPRS